MRILKAANQQAERSRFATEWTAMITLLADLKQKENALKLVDAAAEGVRRLSEPQDPDSTGRRTEIRMDKTVSRAVGEAMTVVRPVMTIVRALVELLQSEQLALGDAERERYVDVLRSFLTDEDGIVILGAVAEGQLRREDREFLDQRELLRNMHGKARKRVESYYSAVAKLSSKVAARL